MEFSIDAQRSNDPILQLDQQQQLRQWWRTKTDLDQWFNVPEPHLP